MTWLLPSALAIGGIAALATIALHFIARSRPLAEPLPTARFIPQRTVRARTRSMALSDVALLIVRVAAVLVLAAAVAGPVIAGAHGRSARVILADRSRSSGGVAEVRDSARALVRPGDVLIAFDTSARAVSSADSIIPSTARGSLSAALAAAVRAAGPLAARADSLELAIVSPVTSDEVDAATLRLRAMWPGRARLIRTQLPATVPTSAPIVESRADANDAVIAGLSLFAPLRPRGIVRVVRGVPTAVDSAWARDSARVLVHWPATDSSASWRARATIDAAGGVVSATGAIVARLPRVWSLEGRAIARWPDGDAAATEQPLGKGCVRDVAILFDPAGDATVQPAFREFSRALVGPCDGASPATLADSATYAAMRGPSSLAPASAFVSHGGDASRWTPWLLALGAALLLLELAMRRTNRMVA